MLFHLENLFSKEVKKLTNDRRMVCCLAISAGVAILVICFIAICAILFVEIARLESDNSRIEAGIEGCMDSLQLQINSATVQQLNSSFDQLLMNQEVSLQALISSIQMTLMEKSNLLDDLRPLHSEQSQASPVSSCAALSNRIPSFPSGYYWVMGSDGSAVRVYCDMTLSCGNVTGGWMRVAELDMSNSRHQCPSGFRQRTNSNKRTCVSDIPLESSGCHQGIISAHNLSYSKACGQIIAYQVGSTDAFYRTSALSNATIDNSYVDGISLTHGNSPREHIWTFAAGANEQPQDGPFTCPCVDNSPATPPSFVEDDYFCETGHNSIHLPRRGQYYSDCLWDGAGCGAQSACCTFNTPPWFYKQLPQPITDDIEMRVCTDEPRSTEDIAIEIIEIYIQ
jgi:dynein heavy chain